ncbi:MAG: c-type cytochrome [Acidimicrobiales bacterium]
MPLRARSARRLLLTLPIACAIAAGATTAFAQGGATAEARTGREIYLGDCATCHGPTGRGSDRGPTLEGVGAAAIDFMVRTGRMPLDHPDDPSMRRPPAYDRAAQRRLIAYATELTGGGPAVPEVDLAAGDLSEGGRLYRLQCAACHSWAGNGGALADRAAPAVTPASPVEIAEAVRTGPGAMPVFGSSAISDDQLSSLVAYTHALQDPDDRGGWALWHLGPMSEGAAGLILGVGGLLVVARWLGTRT